jgi:glutamate racemase
MISSRPIGAFDSGVGGLSVLAAIRQELPGESVLYVADSGYAPYGDRSPAFIERRAMAIVEFLEHEGAKAVVVACNTVTGVAVAALRARFAFPIVAIEPAIKPAVAETSSRVVGVLATSVTLSSPNVGKLVDRHGAGVEVIMQPCPGFVELVEKGVLSGDVARRLVEQHVRPVLDRGADTLVLGCTHYPFLAQVIRDVAGPGVTIIDPSIPVARELRRRLAESGLLASEDSTATERFWSSGPPEEMRAVMPRLWTSAGEVAALPESYREGDRR